LASTRALLYIGRGRNGGGTVSEKLTLYEQGQLIAAAVRLHNYREKSPPTPEDVAQQLGFSVELTHHVINKMAELGALRVMSGAFGNRVLLDDVHKIDELEGKDATPSIEDEVAQFQAAQALKNEEVARRFSKDFVDEKKQSLKADLAAKLADPSKLKRSENPLDNMFKKKE
jgi:hypothetical protein